MSEDHGDGPHQRGSYKKELRQLQIELVQLHRHLIGHGDRLLVLFEGRDAAGKDGTIKRIVEHLSPRETRVVALGKPSDRECTQWYFQRYTPYLPAAGEFVLFNRSWYNRAGVEKIMGFCNQDEYEEFLGAVVPFERMLVGAGIQLFKYYLDISKSEQKSRLKERRKDPLTQWKVSPIDDAAIKHWDDYSAARDAMLERTDHAQGPWIVVQADDKKQARLNVIRDLLQRADYPHNGKHKEKHIAAPDPEVVFRFSPKRLDALAR